MNRYLRMAGLLTLCATGGSAMAVNGASAAEPTSADIGIGVTVVDDCKISATDIDFGNYSGVTGEDLTATGTVTVNCNTGTDYTVTLDNGDYYDQGSAGRKMLHASLATTYINYDLYLDSGHATRWGTEEGFVASSGENGYEGGVPGETHTVYGLIPANQLVPSGAYSDTVVATVVYDDDPAPDNPEDD